MYKSPAFLNGNLGVIRISESGIFEMEHCFTKIYSITGFQEEKRKQLLEKWRTLGMECGILQGRYLNGKYFIIREECHDMSEAMEKFAGMEQELEITGLSAEQRIKGYCEYISKVLGEQYQTENYLLETPVWKTAVSMNKLKVTEKEIVTETGYFSVIAIRRFSSKGKKGSFQKLENKEYVAASYLSALKVTNQRIREAVEEEYLGVDGVLPRMKRKEPLLYDIMSTNIILPNGIAQASENTGSFMSVSAYFLLQAETLEEQKKNMADFFQTAGESGMQAEKIPLAELNGARERRETFAMFGLMGNCQKRYGNFLPADDMFRILVYQSEKEDHPGQTYDVEEMRALFFGENEGRKEKYNEQE